jgi:signal transduction histidine kinase
MADRKDKLIEAGLELASEHSLDVVLQRIVELATELTDARYGAIGVLGPGDRIVEFIAIGVSPEERARIGDPPQGHGILGLLISEARPLRLRNIADHPSSVGFPPNHPKMRSFLGAPVVAHGTVFGNIYLTEKRSADEFDAGDLEALTVLATQAGVAVESARLILETERRARILAGLHEIVTAILSSSDPDEPLRLVAAQARDIVSADLVTFAVPASSGELTIRVADGLHADELVGSVFPLEGSISGEVIAGDRAELLDDASADVRSEPIVALGTIGPSMIVPLSAGGHVSGTLAVCRRRNGPRFTPEELHLMTTFAAQAAVALEYASAHAKLRDLSVLQDRERIARELHDGVIQSLFAAGMSLQGATALTDDLEAQRRIESVVTDIDGTIRDLRNYIFGLQPTILADRELDQALRGLTEGLQQRTGIVAVADIDPHAAAELSFRSADLVQFAREALSNVDRHSGAATCRVSLSMADGAAMLEVDDDGKGFDQAAATAGSGLPNLEARALAIGGELSIESSPQGTTVRITIPLR